MNLFGEKDKRFVKLRFLKKGYGDDRTFRKVLRTDAEGAIKNHQNGNNGPVLLSTKSGAKISIMVHEYVAIEME